MKPYWHNLKEEVQQTVIELSGLNFGEVVQKFKQPNWCSLYKGLDYMEGCWSLFYGMVRNPQYCQNCEYFEPTKEE